MQKKQVLSFIVVAFVSFSSYASRTVQVIVPYNNVTGANPNKLQTAVGIHITNISNTPQTITVSALNNNNTVEGGGNFVDHGHTTVPVTTNQILQTHDSYTYRTNNGCCGGPGLIVIPKLFTVTVNEDDGALTGVVEVQFINLDVPSSQAFTMPIAGGRPF